MYCVRCGVKLADTEKQCPLCATPVFHPDILRQPAEDLYPKKIRPALGHRRFGPLIILSALFLLPLLVVLLCDLQLNRTVTWSGYVIGALLAGYVVLVLPQWFRKPNPVVFVPCGFAAAGVYLLYINLATGGDWFLSFAFPITGGVGLIVTAVVTLTHYLRRGKLYVFGGAAIALGAFMPLMEHLIVLTFHLSRFIGWSLYPLIAFVLLGGVLIFFAICRPARETMERKIFI